MQDKILIINITVIHQDFLNFLDEIKEEIKKVYLISDDLQRELSNIPSEVPFNIASIGQERARDLLFKLGFDNISILTLNNISMVKDKKVVLVNDEVSRNLYDKYLKSSEVEWESVFLRWDEKTVIAEIPIEGIDISKDQFDIEMMQEAYKEAEKSGDWWRQVGGMIVKNKEIILRAYNQGMPNNQTIYQTGMVRDFFKAGERQELANTIHAEPKIIAEAAQKGICLSGTSLYITHFPCAVCSKMVAFSGIKNLYFSEGASTLHGKEIMENFGIKITRIDLTKKEL